MNCRCGCGGGPHGEGRGRHGHWESTVAWLEIGEGDSLLYFEETFYSREEIEERLKERVELGLVYDIVSVTEYSVGSEELWDLEEGPENGFYPKKEGKGIGGNRQGSQSVSSGADPVEQEISD